MAEHKYKPQGKSTHSDNINKLFISRKFETALTHYRKKKKQSEIKNKLVDN